MDILKSVGYEPEEMAMCAYIGTLVIHKDHGQLSVENAQHSTTDFPDPSPFTQYTQEFTDNPKPMLFLCKSMHTESITAGPSQS